MIATEPLPPEVGRSIGLDRAQTFHDARHLIVYGQRTTDDRLAFGGRGAPYHLSSAIRPSYDQVESDVPSTCGASSVELFPVLRRAEITHALGRAARRLRDWSPSVGLDPETGIGWAGGYVGDGVATTNLAGRTLADLVTGADSPLVAAAVGRATAHRGGSPSRCAGPGSPRLAGQRCGPIGPSSSPGTPAASRPC